ncbi:superoxide dismutase [Patescibacteria group bacterium]|nr:superoxide dismutase [Patescibacteria group bacterium]
MPRFTARTFKIPKIKGISEKTIEEHLKLYQGYVKNANSILEKIPEYSQWAEKDPFVPYFTGELNRRFSFEYNGMRNHEIYFAGFEGGPKSLADSSPLKKMIAEAWGSFDAWLAKFKGMAASVRGIGWQVLWYDPIDEKLLMSWVDEQHYGELNGCSMILGLDMWEHSYVADYQPSGKKAYIEDFFANLNWETIESNLERARE